MAILGASALAVGLALQGSLSNLSAGVIIMVTRPFKIGDYIEAGGDAGVVELISLLATTLKTVDNKKTIIPNSKLIGNSLTNYTAEKIRRIDLAVGVSYDSDLRKVRNVLIDEITKDQRVLKDSAPFVGAVGMADSSVNLVVRPWVNTTDYWNVFFSLNENIKLRLDAEGIPIPFPQTDRHSSLQICAVTTPEPDAQLFAPLLFRSGAAVLPRIALKQLKPFCTRGMVQTNQQYQFHLPS